MRAVVLGVGNPLYGDDGFGIEAVASFGRRWAGGPELEIVDAGTEGLSLLGYIEDSTHLVILDVVQGNGLQPGQRVEYDAARLASGTPLKLSEHQVGVEEVLGVAAWRGQLPEHAVLIGVVPVNLEFGLGLTPAVADAMPAVLARAAEVLTAWGVPLAEVPASSR